MKNNKGFSLVELIIVIAIISVLTSAATIGFTYLYNTNVKSSIKKIDNALKRTQSYTISKSTGGRDIGMKLQQESDGNYSVEFIGIPNLTKEKIGNKRLKVRYTDTSGVAHIVNYTNGPLIVYFDRSTGGLLTLSETSSVKVSSIEITTSGDFSDSSKCCKIKISGVTGKTEVTMFQ